MYVGQPLDTVKVKMQTFPELYSNAFRCFKNTFTQEGRLQLFINCPYNIRRIVCSYEEEKHFKNILYTNGVIWSIFYYCYFL